MTYDIKSKKILLVDDDPDLLDQTKIQLEALGHKVFTAENVEDGWNLFKKEKPEAAIVDLIMEEHDSGFILCHKIKKDEHGKKIPVFILTSATYTTGFKFDSSTEEEKEWIKCDEIIEKPVITEDLLQKLESYWSA